MMNHLDSTWSWANESEIPSSMLCAGQNVSMGDDQQPSAPQTDSHASQLSIFRFLELPYEIRVLIYIQLFSTQMLEPFSSGRGWKPGLCSPITFRPVPSEPSTYSLLLANRHCFHEGIKFYYQHCTVLNATWVSSCAFAKRVFRHSHTEQQRFIVRTEQNHTYEVILAKGITSNAWSVVEATRRTVEHSRTFHINVLTQFGSLKDVLIKMPRMEWDHWPELQQTIPPNTRPSDKQLRFYHAGITPANELGGRFIKGLRRRTHFGDQATMEAELVAVMQSMPHTTFRARIPVTYKYDDEQVWEICEYDLRSLKLTTRKRVSEIEIAQEKFPEPELSDRNYTYYNW